MMVALSLAVVLPLLALVLDIGHALVVKQALHNLVDAASLAGTRQLGRLYEGLPPNGRSRSLSAAEQGRVTQVVADVSGKNQPPQHPAVVRSTLGAWDVSSRRLLGGNVLPNGLQISAQAQVPTLVASVMGVTTIAVSAEATAALTGLSQVPAGSLALPFGIARGWFGGTSAEWERRSFVLTKNGTGPPCAAWSTFAQTPATQRQLQRIVKGIRTGRLISPAAHSGQTQFQFLGAKPGSAFAEVHSLYNHKRDPITGEWFTVVPVYEQKTCAAATGRAAIVGFATVKLRQKSKTQLSATVVSDQIRTGRGGGTDYGTKGSIPGLVD